MGDRAVSEVLGFILVFSLIVTTTSFVYVSGISELEDRRDVERVDNAERAFDVLADNLEDIYKQDAPSRATEIKLADAQIALGQETVVRVTVTNLDSSNPKRERSTNDLRPIVYSSAESSVIYENGAVFRRDGSSAVMKRKPALVSTGEHAGDETAVVSLVETRKAGAVSVGGTTTTLIQAEQVDTVTTAYVDPADQYSVKLSISTSPERASEWQEYLEKSTGGTADCSSVGSGNACIEFNVDRLYVTQWWIDVELN
jgi:hypothetical protein